MLVILTLSRRMDIPSFTIIKLVETSATLVVTGALLVVFEGSQCRGGSAMTNDATDGSVAVKPRKKRKLSKDVTKNKEFAGSNLPQASVLMA